MLKVTLWCCLSGLPHPWVSRTSFVQSDVCLDVSFANETARRTDSHRLGIQTLEDLV